MFSRIKVQRNQLNLVRYLTKVHIKTEIAHFVIDFKLQTREICENHKPPILPNSHLLGKTIKI